MPSAIELFSGCGGLSTGLIAAGFEVLSAVEINQTAADTYGLNHPTVNLIVDDVRNVTAVSLLRRHNLRIGELDLLAGCSPCQGFSRLRKGESGSTDPRNQLVLEFLRLVRGLRPKTVFMENVPGLITTEYGEKLFKERLSLKSTGVNRIPAYFSSFKAARIVLRFISMSFSSACGIGAISPVAIGGVAKPNMGRGGVSTVSSSPKSRGSSIMQ